VTTFKSRTDKIVREVRASKLAAGHKRVYAPGEIEAETEARYREQGIPLNDETLKELTETAASLGVDSSL